MDRSVTDCAKCAEESKKKEQVKINEAISKAMEEAPQKGIKGGFVLIVQRVNKSGYFWVEPGDERSTRLTIVDRVWIN